eukprot:9645022-Alexandrium_andersonii.AAC.1
MALRLASLMYDKAAAVSRMAAAHEDNQSPTLVSDELSNASAGSDPAVVATGRLESDICKSTSKAAWAIV